MNRVFIGKFKYGDQLERNYYRHDESTLTDHEYHFSGLQEGDFVLPIRDAKVSKLFKLIGFEAVDGEMGVKAKFETVKTFDPSISLATVCFCKYFQPNLVLMNKAVKSTRGIGFHQLQLENTSISITDIDFNRDKRRYFVCTSKKLEDISFFKPSDICVVITDKTTAILDIVEFNGQQFNQHAAFYTLLQNKVTESEKQYTLKELCEFASPKCDDAKMKENYLKAVISSLEEDEIFSVDNIVSLYDNLIVGRKRTSKQKKQNDKSIDSLDENSEEDELIDFEDLSAYEPYAKLMEFNPNIILYGPPGTGKTYGAKKIIEAFEQMNGNPVSFEAVQKEGRAKFTTFHQAFSYEEFIEGIRPRVDEEGRISYPVEPGIFREFAEDCRIQSEKKNLKDNSLIYTTPTSKVWKVSLGRRNEDDKYKILRDKNVIAYGAPANDVSDYSDTQIDELDTTGMLKAMHSKMAIGDIIFIFDSIRTIRLIGVITSEYFYTEEDTFGYNHRRSVKWLRNCENNPIDIFELNRGKQLTLSAIYELKISATEAIALIDIEEDKETPAKSYYLIIDEINRGNIAKIFGELITLIEKDKRESLSCTLPYSKKQFTLPKNLYIIGTMNTSDRSIALLDTALRRRFAFIEIQPDSSLLDSVHLTIGGNVSPSKLLQAINNKLTKEIDRDHRIGHSYFWNKDLVTKYDLYNVWYFNIIPLLMEYFYNDVEKVSEIIGPEFVNKTTKEIEQLSTKANEDNISDFESALIKIYKGED